MLKMIITNELNKRLHRNATASEAQDCYLYITDNLGLIDGFADLNDLMDTYIANNFRQCCECGEYCLIDEMNADYRDYCLECRPNYDPDYDYYDNQAMNI